MDGMSGWDVGMAAGSLDLDARQPTHLYSQVGMLARNRARNLCYASREFKL